MTQKFTAEEVREYAERVDGDSDKSFSLQHCAKLLNAFADTLSKPADSGRAGDVEKVLAALGHVRVPNTRCLARVAETPPQLRPPGPQNPPMWCYLQEGHDGNHRHNGGGMYPSIPFRDTDEIAMGDPLPDYCEKCHRIWPCDDAGAIEAALAAQGQGQGEAMQSRLAAADALLRDMRDGAFNIGGWADAIDEYFDAHLSGNGQ